MGLILFALAWSFWTVSPQRTDAAEGPQLLVRPVNAVVKVEGTSLPASSSLGLFLLSSEASQITVEREGWDRQALEVSTLGEFNTLRLKAPLAKLQARTSNGKVVRLQVLPDKEALQESAGYIRLRPGSYRFLAQAEGHFPQDLSLDLAAGEVRQLTVNLKAIPQAPKPRPPVVVPRPSVVQLPERVPQPYYPPPPVARPQPRPQAQPRPQPLPRFTPVAPSSQPVQPQPAPLFTPLSP